MARKRSEGTGEEGFTGYSRLCQDLAENEINVTLIQIATWPRDQVDATEAWLSGRGSKPAFLATGGKTAAISTAEQEVPKQETNLADQVKAKTGEKIAEQVKATSEALRRELDPNAEALSRAEDVDDPNFVDLPRVSMSERFERIVTTMFVDDVDALFEKLEAKLRSIDSKAEGAFYRHALTTAAADYYDSRRLLVTAKALFSDWEKSNALVVASMREHARKNLLLEKQEKQPGERAKMVTEADVETRAVLLHADEWEAAGKKRRRYELTIQGIEAFCEAWSFHNNNSRVLAKE